MTKRIIVVAVCALAAGCTTSSPQSCLTTSECGEGVCVNGVCEDAPEMDGGVDAAVIDSGGVDSSVDVGASDAPLDIAPDIPTDGFVVRVDAGALPTYLQSEGPTVGVRVGGPVEIGDYVVWMQQNAAGTVTWYNRMTGEITDQSLGSQYTQRSSTAVQAGSAWVAWERTMGAGFPEGVSLTNIGVAPNQGEVANVDIPGALGFPQLIVVGGTLIIIAEVSATRQIAAFVINDNSITRVEPLPGERLRHAAAMEGGFVYAASDEVRVVRTVDWTIEESLPVGGQAHRVAFLGDRIFVGCSAGLDAYVRSFTMGGTMLAEAQVRVEAPASDPRIISDGRVILAVGRIPGDALLLDQNLDVVENLGIIGSNPWLGVTSGGFAVVAPDRPITFIERDE